MQWRELQEVFTVKWGTNPEHTVIVHYYHHPFGEQNVCVLQDYIHTYVYTACTQTSVCFSTQDPFSVPLLCHPTHHSVFSLSLSK